jgi:hypothetical protein
VIINLLILQSMNILAIQLFNLNHYNRPVGLNNNVKIAVCTQWNAKNIAKFIGRAKELGFAIAEQKEGECLLF